MTYERQWMHACIRNMVDTNQWMLHQVCKHWYELANDNCLWRQLCLDRWPRISELYTYTAKPWKWIYRSQSV
jgi:hypothetical protein